MDPHGKFVEGHTKGGTIQESQLEAGTGGSGLGKKEITNDGEEKYAVGKMMNVNSFYLKEEIGEGIQEGAGNREGDKETNHDKKRDFLTVFWFEEAPRFHGVNSIK